MKKTMKFNQFFAIVLAVSFFAFGCKKEEETDRTDPFILGAVYDLTGDQSALDIPSSRGAQLAVDEVNGAGGIGGSPVRFILKDGKTDTDVLRTNIAEILEEYPETAAFLGLSDSDQVLAAAGAASESKRAFLTSGATSPQLPGQIPEYLYLACFGDNVQAAAAAEYAYNDLGARSAAVIYDSTQIYTRLLQSYFITRFEQLGGQIVTINAYDQQDLSQITTGIQGADLLFLSAMPQNVLEGIEKVRFSGFNGPVVGGDGFDSDDIWQGRNGIRDVFFTTHAYLNAGNPNPKIRAFREAYIRAYNGEEPGAFAALGYDAANLLIKARRIAGSNDPDEVRNALASIRNFEGITGTISFGAGSQIPNKSVTILEVKDGATALAAEVVPVNVPAP